MNRQGFNHEPDSLRLVDDGVTLGDAETGSIERMLDRLGRAERAGAPPDLAGRVFERSRGQLGPRVAARIRPNSASDRADGAPLLTPLRAAAALAFAATVGVAILATGSGRTTFAHAARNSVPIEPYIDAWASNSRDLTGDLSARVSALDAEMAALRDDLSRSPAAYDPWSDEGAL